MATLQQALAHGWQLHQQGQLRQAESIYRQVIDQVPGSADAQVYLGITLFDQRRFEDAEAAYREGLKLRPKFPIAWNNLGNALRMLNRLDDADACFSKAIEQQPDYLSPFKNRGTLWVWSGAIERGLDWYRMGLDIAPEDPELHRNLGVIELLRGNLNEGWEEYRWRWRMPGIHRPAVSGKLWQGEPLTGKSILLYAEQGLGDAIHFIRMAGVLKAAGAWVGYLCEPRMVPLLSTAPGIDQIIVPGSEGPVVDYHASLIDVADYARDQVIGLPEGPYLSVPESLNAYWRGQLASLGGRKIGLCWQGNPQHHADVYRSVPLAALEPLTEIADLNRISLQFGHGVEQLQQVRFADKIRTIDQPLDQSGAFLDTAAILKQLDCLVTSDTAIAHLAGALGVPVYLMLGKVPDWRWGMEGATTHWYPSMRLFRQSNLGDWSGVVDEVSKKLET